MRNNLVTSFPVVPESVWLAAFSTVMPQDRQDRLSSGFPSSLPLLFPTLPPPLPHHPRHPPPCSSCLAFLTRSCRSRWSRAFNKNAYNMGNSSIIPFQDFKEAVEALMERNMPDVLQNRQTEVASVSQCNAMHCNGESVRRQGVQSVHKQQPVTWQQNAQYPDNRNSSVIAGRVRQDYTESWFWVVLKRKFQTWVEVAKLAWTVVK